MIVYKVFDKDFNSATDPEYNWKIDPSKNQETYVYPRARGEGFFVLNNLLGLLFENYKEDSIICSYFTDHFKKINYYTGYCKYLSFINILTKDDVEDFIKTASFNLKEALSPVNVFNAKQDLTEKEITVDFYNIIYDALYKSKPNLLIIPLSNLLYNAIKPNYLDDSVKDKRIKFYDTTKEIIEKLYKGFFNPKKGFSISEDVYDKSLSMLKSQWKNYIYYLLCPNHIEFRSYYNLWTNGYLIIYYEKNFYLYSTHTNSISLKFEKNNLEVIERLK